MLYGDHGIVVYTEHWFSNIVLKWNYYVVAVFRSRPSRWKLNGSILIASIVHLELHLGGPGFSIAPQSRLRERCACISASVPTLASPYLRSYVERLSRSNIVGDVVVTTELTV